MRLYTKTGAAQVDDPEYGKFTPDANGAFEFPEPMGVKLHGRPGWETEEVRTARIAAEELDRLRDPATLLAELRKMGEGQGALTALMAHVLGMAPAPVETPTVNQTPSTPAEAQSQNAGSGPEASAETGEAVATAKATGRGRGGKAAKSTTPDAS